MKRSYRAKTLNTRKTKIIPGSGEIMAKTLIRFDLYLGVYRRHIIKMKFPAMNSAKLRGDIIDCTNYESRSGLHWEKCYRFVEEYKVIVPYFGSVRKLKTVYKMEPTVYADLFKKIPREGKNVVRISVEQYKKLQQAMLILMNNILIDNKNLLLYCNEDVAEVNIVRFYDYRIKGVLIDNQSNLEIYWIEKIPKIVKVERTAKIEISKHTIEFNRPVMFAKAENIVTSRYDIEAAIIQLLPGTEIKLTHPEHGEKKIEINDYRITNLLALHISSKYVE